MGDWRTLHFFNKENFLKETVPLIKDTDFFFSKFLNSKHSKWLDGFSQPRDFIITDTKKFISELDSELNVHSELCKILEKGKDELYNDFVQRQNRQYEAFICSRQCAIEFFEYILIETIFSTQADFNPHFILGKRSFESCVDAKKRSVAEELINKLTSRSLGSVLDLIDGGIINWLDHEEVQLLFLDKVNILPADNTSIEYVIEFKEFIKMAFENKYGFITMRNPRECDLSNVQSQINPLEETVRSSNFKYIIVKSCS